MDFQTLYQRLINCSEDQITEEVKKLVTDNEVDAIIKSKEFSSFYRCNVTEISLLTLYYLTDLIIVLYLKLLHSPRNVRRQESVCSM